MDSCSVRFWMRYCVEWRCDLSRPDGRRHGYGGSTRLSFVVDA